MKVDKNEFYREVTSRICSSLDIKEAFSEMYQYVKQYIPVDFMSLVYTDRDKRQALIVAREPERMTGFDDAITFAAGIKEPFPLSNDYIETLSIAGLRGGYLVLANRPEDQNPRLIEQFPILAGCSYMILILYSFSNQAVGALLVVAKGFKRFSKGDAALLKGVQEPIAIAMSNANRYLDLVHMNELLAENNKVLSEDMKRSLGVEVIGSNDGLREVMEQVRQLAASRSPALLLGETGTGKEVIANTLHQQSPRSKGPMITLQCGAVPETLLDSELFGHEKGAFTGASERKYGRFELADGGTIFLDEIGELSPEAQVKLLRVLQESRFERVGGTKTIEVDVRVIAATHRDLKKMIGEGRFREDLWYRLNVLPIHIPPLRLRPNDIPSLVRYFIEKKAQEMNLIQIPEIDNDSLDNLMAYSWPGNVRELQNIVERALILSRNGRLVIPELDTPMRILDEGHPPRKMDAIETIDQVLEKHIRFVLEVTEGRINGSGGAAELLQIHPSTLRSRMKKMGIQRRWSFDAEASQPLPT